MKTNKRWPLALLIFCSVSTDAQQNSTDRCVLSSAKNGQVVTVRGKVVHAPHDMIVKVPNCEAVVLVYAGASDAPGSDPDSSLRKPTLRRDASFKKFEKYQSAEYKHLPRGGVCNGCYKYEVEATFTGNLKIASIPEGLTKDASGFLRDASGNVVGKAGFGHPAPIYGYLMVVESVSDVVARKLPSPSSTSVDSDLPARSGAANPIKL
jgi:hypothetical protein